MTEIKEYTSLKDIKEQMLKAYQNIKNSKKLLIFTTIYWIITTGVSLFMSDIFLGIFGSIVLIIGLICQIYVYTKYRYFSTKYYMFKYFKPKKVNKENV